MTDNPVLPSTAPGKRGMLAAAAVGLLMSAAIGYWGGLLRGLRDSKILTDNVAAQSLVEMEERAMEAYLHEDPKTGIWALRQLIAQLERRAKQAPENRLLRREDLLADLMWSHCRLAKLYRSTGDPLEKDEIRLALDCAAQRGGKGEPATEDELFRFLDRIDANCLKREAYSPPPAAGAERGTP